MNKKRVAGQYITNSSVCLISYVKFLELEKKNNILQGKQLAAAGRCCCWKSDLTRLLAKGTY